MVKIKSSNGILECPICGCIILLEYPIENNQINKRDMNKVEEHMRNEHPERNNKEEKQK